MKLAKVVGCVVCTAKNPSLVGKKILLLQDTDETGRLSGEPFAALDAVGVGSGETVFYVTAREAAFPFEPEEVPADACILGVVDRVTVPPDGLSS